MQARIKQSFCRGAKGSWGRGAIIRLLWHQALCAPPPRQAATACLPSQRAPSLCALCCSYTMLSGAGCEAANKAALSLHCPSVDSDHQSVAFAASASISVGTNSCCNTLWPCSAPWESAACAALSCSGDEFPKVFSHMRRRPKSWLDYSAEDRGAPAWPAAYQPKVGMSPFFV